jgi:hypothetical protein
MICKDLGNSINRVLKVKKLIAVVDLMRRDEKKQCQWNEGRSCKLRPPITSFSQ